MDTTTEMQTTWKQLCALEEIPVLGSRVVKGTKHGDIAVFRTSDDDVIDAEFKDVGDDKKKSS